jgi:ADP-sugar diphosphatase
MNMMSANMRKIDNEIHTCMQQLESLRAGVHLFDHSGFTMLGVQDPYPHYPIPNGTFIVNIHGHNITVERDACLTNVSNERLELIFSMKAFHDWLHNFDPEFFNQCTFTKILIQSIDIFGERVGFLKFNTDIRYNAQCGDLAGKAVPGIVFMRGPAVAMLIVLRCEEKHYALTTIQSRVAIGKFSFCEIPAGMVDDNQSFTGTAAKEIKEETGIAIHESQLIDLGAATGIGKNGVYPSVGGLDEYLKFYLFYADVHKDSLTKLHGRLTGVVAEGESISLKVLPLDQLPFESPDMKTCTALYYYSRLDKGTEAFKAKIVNLTGHDFSKPAKPTH